ncbi:uncharacterized protein LOC120781506 [Bactrocera tryoni]|uniref:uncharacterized protein LOC120781506 n=1 Tax=Bactrocera tryoni TaxID=59916 RepID=UPI001A96E59A|nr:uncharacterized protein LOC120781506 [Bactrocera tryoni]
MQKIAIIILLLLWLPIAMANLDVTNYTDTHTIILYKGIRKLQTSSIKLIHLIDVQQIEIELLKIQEHTVKDLWLNELSFPPSRATTPHNTPLTSNTGTTQHPTHKQHWHIHHT